MQEMRIATISLAALLAAACGSSRPQEAAAATVSVPGGGPLSVAECTKCHGDPSRTTAGSDPLVQFAPPRAPSGAVADPAIGAHLKHLVDGTFSRAVACSSCHYVPASASDHRAPRVLFSGLATTAWAGAPAIAPSYAAPSCSATYCHGAFPNGAGANPIAWSAGSSAAACGTCHGIPPTQVKDGGSHPDVEANRCERCHTGYTSSTVDLAVHVNGRVDVGPLTCTSCHGDPARPGQDANAQAFAPAPPTDSSGSSTSPAVGAHLRHLTGTAFSRKVSCAECHSVPTAPPAGGGDTHGDGAPTIAFGPLARNAWANQPPIAPTWDGTAGVLGCASTYCHGNFPNGKRANTPSWTATTLACDSCHGFPPDGPSVGGTHPEGRFDCDTCHADRINGLPDPAFHVNGVVDCKAGVVCP